MSEALAEAVRITRLWLLPLQLVPLVVLFWLQMPAASAGFEVILMRHGDKDPARGDFNLSPAGFARAIGLARLIPACFGLPSEIHTYLLDLQSSKNARSYQSAVPLAVATGLNIRVALSSQDHSFEIGQQLRRRAGGPQARLVLFWEHRRMPELARGLGWDGMSPIAEDDFDQLWLFRYASPEAPPRVSVVHQSDLVRQACFRSAQSPLDGRWPSPFSVSPR